MRETHAVLKVLILVWVFISTHTLCMQAVNTLSV